MIVPWALYYLTFGTKNSNKEQQNYIQYIQWSSRQKSTHCDLYFPAGRSVFVAAAKLPMRSNFGGIDCSIITRLTASALLVSLLTNLNTDPNTTLIVGSFSAPCSVSESNIIRKSSALRSKQNKTFLCLHFGGNWLIFNPTQKVPKSKPIQFKVWMICFEKLDETSTQPDAFSRISSSCEWDSNSRPMDLTIGWGGGRISRLWAIWKFTSVWSRFAQRPAAKVSEFPAHGPISKFNLYCAEDGMLVSAQIWFRNRFSRFAIEIEFAFRSRRRVRNPFFRIFRTSALIRQPGFVACAFVYMINK